MSGAYPPWTGPPFRTWAIDAATRDAARPFFASLPADPYVQHGWRARRLTRFRLGPGDERAVLPPSPVWQTRANNRRFGDLPRSFAPLEEAWIAHPAFDRLVGAFRAALPEPVDGCTLWAHQIRTFWRDGTAPPHEGVHRDERVYLAILVFASDGLAAGPTRLLASRDGPILHEAPLRPGEGLVFDDERLWHETLPPPDGSRGHRDTMLFAVTRSERDGTPAERTSPA